MKKGENICFHSFTICDFALAIIEITAFSYGILAQLGEHLPYKQRVIGSSPIGPINYADVAQLAEQLICNQQVTGSSPVVGFINIINDFGRIPERPKGADCKSVSYAFEGSNPSPPTYNG